MELPPIPEGAFDNMPEEYYVLLVERDTMQTERRKTLRNIIESICKTTM